MNKYLGTSQFSKICQIKEIIYRHMYVLQPRGLINCIRSFGSGINSYVYIRIINREINCDQKIFTHFITNVYNVRTYNCTSNK